LGFLAQASIKGNDGHSNNNKQRHSSHQQNSTWCQLGCIIYTRISSKCLIVRAVMEAGSKGKGGGGQTNKPAKLGSILEILSQTIQLVDDLVMLNYLHTKNGAITDECYICWVVEICDRLTDAAQPNDRYMRSQRSNAKELVT